MGDSTTDPFMKLGRQVPEKAAKDPRSPAGGGTTAKPTPRIRKNEGVGAANLHAMQLKTKRGGSQTASGLDAKFSQLFSQKRERA